MKKSIFCSLVLVMASSLVINTPVLAQKKAPSSSEGAAKSSISTNAKIGDKFLENGEYANAVDYYLKALRNKPSDMYAQYKLGVAYENMLEYGKAEFAYQRVYQARVKNQNLLTFRYGNMLKLNGKYDEAKKYFTEFLSTFKPEKPEEEFYSDLARLELKGCDLAINERDKKLPDFKLRLLPSPVNSLASDYAPTIWENDSAIVLTTARPEARGGSKDPVLGGSFSDLFYFKKAGKEWERTFTESAFEEINSKLSEGAGVFTADKKKFYYTSCADEDQCQIFVMTLEDDFWGKPVLLNTNINMPGFASKQPSITPKGDTMFFVSNRPGGLGGNDIWYSVNRGNDSWDVPVNLGEALNTNQNDMSPFYYAPEKLLFFSTNGRESFGGLDIYMATGKDFDKVVNAGYPFNSSRDDFYFTVGKNYAYFSSNRENGIGSDDIYSMRPFDVAPSLAKAISDKERIASGKPEEPVKTETDNSQDVTGKLVDSTKNADVANKVVELVDEKGNTVKKTETDEKGNFAFNNLPDNRDYSVKPAKPTKPAKPAKSTKPSKKNVKPVIETEDEKDAVEPVITVKKTRSNKPSTRFNYENIYFDFDSDKLRPEAEATLKDIVAYSKNESGIQVEMNSYTDGIGNSAYNKILAERRADVAKEFLKANGMENAKFVVRNYGERNFLATNENPAGRQLNRRVEFYILGGHKVSGNMVYVPETATTAPAVGEQFGMSGDEVKQVNALSSDAIAAFQPVRVKRTGASVVAKQSISLSKKANDEFPEIANADRISVNATAMPMVNGEYEIRGGQTLFTVAKLFGTTVDAIKSQNNLSSENLEPGTKIVITAGAKKANRYLVKKGDSLKSIAGKVGISVERLKEINRLEFYTLMEGMQLRTR
ncbi:MAG: LysM peptidoglycan-binding domain-containing protein [Flexibacteraceae bacterium]